MLLAVFLTGVTVTQAQKKQYAIYAVAFYNLENLFDTINQPNTNDEEFTFFGSYRWGGLKYRNKLNNLAYAISNFATDNSSPFKLKRTCRYRRIGNRKQTSIEDLIHTGELSKRNYGIVSITTLPILEESMWVLYMTKTNLHSNRAVAHDFIPQFPNLRTRDHLVVSEYWPANGYTLLSTTGLQDSEGKNMSLKRVAAATTDQTFGRLF